jgi:glyoxylase-like metal-dependent hydrolase (beta-lactamase superfamily II)
MTLPSPAPGVRRAGDALVTIDLVAEGSDLTLVDAGLPGHRDQVVAALATLGRSLRDVRAVLGSHGHPDL